MGQWDSVNWETLNGFGAYGQVCNKIRNQQTQEHCKAIAGLGGIGQEILTKPAYDDNGDGVNDNTIIQHAYLPEDIVVLTRPAEGAPTPETTEPADSTAGEDTPETVLGPDADADAEADAEAEPPHVDVGGV